MPVFLLCVLQVTPLFQTGLDHTVAERTELSKQSYRNTTEEKKLTLREKHVDHAEPDALPSKATSGEHNKHGRHLVSEANLVALAGKSTATY